MEDQSGKLKTRKEYAYWCIIFLSILTICISVFITGLHNDEPIYSTFDFKWNFTALGLAGGLIFGFVGSLSTLSEFINWKKNHPLDKYFGNSSLPKSEVEK